MTREVERHIKRWPQIARAWERAIKATFKPEKGTWATADEYWQWWLNRDAKARVDSGQKVMFEP